MTLRKDLRLFFFKKWRKCRNEMPVNGKLFFKNTVFCSTEVKIFHLKLLISGIEAGIGWIKV